MSYVTQAQIETAIPGPHLIDALDDNGDGQLDGDVLEALIASVSQAVDAFIAALYVVPVDPAPAPVREAAFVFACERIYDRRGIDEKNPWRTRANDWRTKLDEMGSGARPLDGATPRSFAPGAAITSNTSVDTSMG